MMELETRLLILDQQLPCPGLFQVKASRRVQQQKTEFLTLCNISLCVMVWREMADKLRRLNAADLHADTK